MNNNFIVSSSMLFLACIALCNITSAQRYLGTYVHPEKSPTEYSGPAAYMSRSGVFARPELSYLGQAKRIKVGNQWAREIKFDILATLDNLKTMRGEPGFSIEQQTDSTFKMCIDASKFLPGLNPTIWGPAHKGSPVKDGDLWCFTLDYQVVEE